MVNSAASQDEQDHFPLEGGVEDVGGGAGDEHAEAGYGGDREGARGLGDEFPRQVADRVAHGGQAGQARVDELAKPEVDNPCCVKRKPSWLGKAADIGPNIERMINRPEHWRQAAKEKQSSKIWLSAPNLIAQLEPPGVIHRT